MASVVLIGTLDTKGAEYGFVRERLHAAGVDTILVDCGTAGAPVIEPDVSAAEVAAAVGADLAALTAAGDRGDAVTTMARGAAAVALRLHGEGRLDGLLAIGGSGGTSIASAAARALPIGVPKLIVSTMAASDTRPIIGESDLILAASVVDVAGLNSLSRRILANVAAAMAGMVAQPALEGGADRPLVAASMFGVTTPSVTQAREQLEASGYEVLTFHMTGTGGRSMESLIDGGFVAGVLDVTTTELCDELVGGVLSAGPDRLTAAGRRGIPQAVSLGALDMVNFGPRETVPAAFDDRTLYVHNDQITLMRTTPAECAALGREVAEKLSAATGPTALFVPLRGVSMIAVEGGPFHDPAADAALFAAVREGVGPNVELIELDLDVNDPAFSRAMADWLEARLREAGA
ncbi:MAG: Tm-1-like ATP-binding domain-containing protein [Actinomycetota bacterium]